MLGNLFGRPRSEEWKSINVVEHKIRSKVLQIPKLELRAKVKIIVVDDQPFAPMANLRNNKYNITHLEDIRDINIVRPYEIVLCDLQGVGNELSSDLHGAHVIREIKEHFPEKIVISYSGIAKNREMSRVASEHADQFLKKDASLDDWIEALDRFNYIVANPINGWKKIRTRVLNAGVTPEQLMRLEDVFVRGLQKNDANLADNLEISARTFGLSDDVRAIINGLVSSAVFKILIG